MAGLGDGIAGYGEEGGVVTDHSSGGATMPRTGKTVGGFGCRMTSRLKIPLASNCGKSLASGRGNSINNCVIGGVVRRRRGRVTRGWRTGGGHLRGQSTSSEGTIRGLSYAMGEARRVGGEGTLNVSPNTFFYWGSP